MRIPESNIETSIGATPGVTAVQSSGNEIAKAMGNLGEVGTRMFEDLIDKRGTSQYLDFVSEYNTTMETKKSSIREKLLTIDQDGNYKDKSGQVAGNIATDYEDFRTSRSEFVQKGETLQKSMKAKEYFATVRAQDDIQLGLEIEKYKSRAAKKQTIDSVGNISELFATNLMKGTATPNQLNETFLAIKDAADVVGEEEGAKMMSNFTDNSFRAINSYISNNGRTANANRMIASIGGEMPEWKRERYEIAFKESEQAYNRQVIKGLDELGSEVVKATSDIAGYEKFRSNAVDTISKPLVAMNSNIEGLDKESMYKMATGSMARSAIGEAYFSGSSVFSKSTDPQFSEAINKYVTESADTLVKKGSLKKEDRESFIANSVEQAGQIADQNLSLVNGPSRAAFLATWDKEVHTYSKNGEYQKMSNRMEQIYTGNKDISDENYNYVTSALIANEKKAFSAARDLDGEKSGVGLAESAKVLNTAQQLQDKYLDVANRLIGNKAYEPYTILAGHIAGNGDAAFLNTLSRSSQRKSQNQALLNMDTKTKKAFAENVKETLSDMQVPVLNDGGYGYINGISDSVANLALEYMASPKHGNLEMSSAIDKARAEITNQLVIAPARGGMGVVYGRRELDSLGVNEDQLKEVVSNPKALLAASGYQVDKQRLVTQLRKNPVVETQYQELKARQANNQDFSESNLVDNIYNSFAHNITVTKIPNSKDLAIGIPTATGFVPLPITGGKKADISLTEIPLLSNKMKGTREEYKYR